MWAKIGEWLRRNRWWLRYLLLAAALMVGYMLTVKAWARIVGSIAKPTTWKTLPGVTDAVAVMNPNTGSMDVVMLPDNVGPSDLVSVGITETGDDYEIEIKHETSDRRSPTGDGGAATHFGW